ncbi:MAG: sulfite exporter TauE/SafE family protein [Rhodospirillales bacterium]|nr:sulfite exporter TauE/SafE family protein [Rhodospirillales bacterium]
MLATGVLAVLCGGAVGFVLGLIGGGGSILATPLLLYVVGLEPHAAIGTGALAVSVNAFANFAGYARAGRVRWRPAILFAVIGIVGAALGSSLGKVFDGQRLLLLFALLMIVVGVLMLRRKPPPQEAPHIIVGGRISMPKVTGAALSVGLLSGFFGIGGGFLIVPGLLFSTGMPMIAAVASSLLSVGTFGLTTAVNYALSGLVAWGIAAEYILGGLAGGFLGMRLAGHLSSRKAALTRVFAGIIFVVAAYMLWRTAATMGLR